MRISSVPKEAEMFLDNKVIDGMVEGGESSFIGLSDYIILMYEPLLIKEIISYFDNDKELLEEVLRLMLEDKEYSYEKRRALIVKSLLEASSEFDELNFEGFLNFRLYEYENILSDMVISARNTLEEKKEYEDFKHLLKEYRFMTKSEHKEVHIYGFSLFDDMGKEVKLKDEFNIENALLSAGDILLGKLISSNPRKIYVHIAPDEETEKTINDVFFPNVIYLS